MDSERKNHVRSMFLLYLNNAFSGASKHFAEQGVDEDREFLQKLVESVRECVEGETKHVTE